VAAALGLAIAPERLEWVRPRGAQSPPEACVTPIVRSRAIEITAAVKNSGCLRSARVA
jgi:hypothetical protein